MMTKKYTLADAPTAPYEIKDALKITDNIEKIAEKHMRTGRVLKVAHHLTINQCIVIDLSDGHSIRAWGISEIPDNVINDHPEYCNGYVIKVYDENGKLKDSIANRKITENPEGFTMAEVESYMYALNDDLNKAITTYSTSIAEMAYNQVGKVKHATSDAIKKVTSEGIGSLIPNFKKKKKSTDIELTSN